MKRETAEKIESDIANNNYYKAKERLTSLLATYPLDISIRTKLGKICSQMGLTEMAGCYWYLEKEKTDLMCHACEAFEKSCDYDPIRILRTLKVTADLDSIVSSYAQTRIRELRAVALKRYGFYIYYDKCGRVLYRYTAAARLRQKFCLSMVILFLITIIGLVGLGAMTVISYINHFFSY